MQTSPRENDLIKVIKQLLTGIVLIVAGLLVFLLLSIFGWPDFSSPEEPEWPPLTTTAAAAMEEVSKIEPVTTLTEFWTAPDVNTLTDNAEGELIKYGKELVANTALYLRANGKGGENI
jgi:thiosulfate dehydrogenase